MVEYFVTVEGEGVVEIPRQKVRITKNGGLKLLKLAPGRSVRGRIQLLNGESYDVSTAGKLFQGGREVSPEHLNPEGGGWARLPLGTYQLRVQSYRELEEEAREGGRKLPPVPEEQRHEALEVEVKLSEESPAVVELGTINLKRE